VAALIDTHCHLDDEQFTSDLPAVVGRAQAAGVAVMVAVATTSPSSIACLELSRRYPGVVFASAGIHPNHASQAAATAWDEVVALAVNEPVVGIGETGLDRHWHDTPFPQQEDYFARHLALSRRTSKPIIIHCREADADMLRMLRDDFDKNGPLCGVMHSFVGDSAMAAACLAMGLHLSFAGMLTYKNAAALREVAAKQPLDRLLVETDSPYLSPVPLRGKRNEPGNVVHTAACLAGLLGAEATHLAEQTTNNARALFALPQ
jgi:TatD DNase family protein